MTYGNGVVDSEIFGDKTVVGTTNYVTQCLEQHILQLCSQILEALYANMHDWYHDKPNIQSEIKSLYKEFSEWQSQNQQLALEFSDD